MAHQFVREPLRAEEADRLANACRSPEEKLIVWTLLDTGLRVSELCSLTLDNVQWQPRAVRITGKSGPHGTRRKQRIVPLSARVRAISSAYGTCGSSMNRRSDRWKFGIARSCTGLVRDPGKARDFIPL